MFFYKRTFYELNEIVKGLSTQWIKSMRSGTTGIGYTFETLINKEEDSSYKPDFKGIEIKTKRYFSKGNITLFSLNPDGCRVQYIIDRYSYIKDGKRKLFFSTNSDVLFIINRFHKGFIKKDNFKRRLYLVVCDYHGNPIDYAISWSYKILKERLYAKLSYLALVYASIKNNSGIDYYNYNKLFCYRLKGFHEFINLVETGSIRITFKIDTLPDGTYYHRCISFDIHEKDIPLLFDEVKIKR